ncbi:MAG TPA: SIMPL domain-containing protein [Tichowtungia sp.]|nr:SIMPL domain-containing protein [Tichowtungia sp.]
MKTYLLISLACLLSLSAAGATKDDPSITVTVEVQKLVEPDRAYLLIYSNDENSRSEVAQEQSLKKIEKAIEDIQRKHSRKTDYKILNKSITRIEQEAGYVYIAVHCVRFDCPPEAEKLFPMLDDANDSDDTSISPVRGISSGLPYSPLIYAVEDYEKAVEQLEANALAAARARAEKLAAKAGKTIGEVLSINLELIDAEGRGLDLPTPYISNRSSGVMMVQTATVSYQLLP